MRLIAFPHHWDYRRVCEILCAVYASIVGGLFMIHPDTLAATVYDRIGGPDAAPTLGAVLMVAAFLHSFALWMNGRVPRCSRAIRIMACFVHFSILTFFAIEFAVSGVLWGAVSMLLVIVMIYFALHRALAP